MASPGAHASISSCLSSAFKYASCIVDAGLVGRDHVLDVDEGVITSLLLKQGQRVSDQLAKAVVVALPVVDAIAKVPAKMKEGRSRGSGRDDGLPSHV
jgi:hypothetical protein